MSNLSVLQRNIIHGLDCEISAKSFLRACDHTMVLAAEKFGYEVREMVRFLTTTLSKSANGHNLETAPDELLAFILERYWNWRFPPKGNRK